MELPALNNFSSAGTMDSPATGAIDDDFYSDFTTSPAHFASTPTEEPIHVPWFKRMPVAVATATVAMAAMMALATPRLAPSRLRALGVAMLFGSASAIQSCYNPATVVSYGMIDRINDACYKGILNPESSGAMDTGATTHTSGRA